MLATLLNSATSYFYLPVEDETDENDLEPSESSARTLEYPTSDDSGFSSSSASTSSSSIASDFEASPPPQPPPPPSRSQAVINEILSQDDLYQVLGVSRASRIDRLSLRRAYLNRSKACHPDKFPGSVEATQAFQKVNIAYNVLSKPASKRVYDSRPSRSYDFFSARPFAHAEETFRSVVLGVFNDFLDGDLETVRSLLRAVNDLNPSLQLGDEGIDSVLRTLYAIRERALTCRVCVLALHTEVSRILEVQHAFSQLSYFDFRRRSGLALELTRIAIGLPIALERAIQEHKEDTGDPNTNGTLLNHRVATILRGSAIVLERLERLLK